MSGRMMIVRKWIFMVVGITEWAGENSGATEIIFRIAAIHRRFRVRESASTRRQSGIRRK